MTAAVAAAAVLGVAAPISVRAASAAPTNPPWEPDGNAASFGNIVFYDANGVQVTSGTNLANPFAYAVATMPDNASGATKSSLFFKNPHNGVVPANWGGSQEGGTTTYTALVSPTPANIIALGAANYPVSAQTGASITSWLGGNTPDTTAGYANTIQVVLQNSPGGNLGNHTAYWSSDIGYNTTSAAIMVDGTTVPAMGWAQLFPLVSTSTTTMTSPANGGSTTLGSSVMLTASITPSSAAGTVQFYNGSTAIGSPVTVTSGTASTSTTSLPLGTDSLTAVFNPTLGDETGFNTTSATIIGSSTSPAISYTVNPAPTAPGPPTGLSGMAGNTQVALSWTAPASNGGSAITGYNVFEGTTSGAESTTPVNSSLISGTTFTVTGLTNGTTYYFTVKANNSVGASTASNEASATPVPPTVPGAPTGLSAMAGNTQVALSWTAPSSNGGAAITGYNVFEGTTPGGESTTAVNSSLISGTTFTVTGLTNNVTYYFTVKANNSVGASAASNEASATPVPPTVPGAPTGLSGTAGVAQVALTWTAPSSNGGSPITGYNVFDGTTTGGESTTPVNSSPLSGTTYTVTGLTNGTTYFFTVKAINAVGASAASNEASATPNKNATTVTLTSSATTINKGQSATFTATIASSASAARTGTVAFNDGTGNPATTNCPTVTVSGNKATCTVPYPTPGSYSVKATYSGDNSFAGSVSSTLTETVRASSPPGAPTGLKATTTGAGDGTALLSWTAPASSGTSPLIGYDVFVGTTPGGETTTPINSVPVTGTTASVTGLTDGKTYYFKVKAGNAVGWSPASNEASAKPLAGLILASATGGVYTYGSNGFDGSLNGKPLNAPIVAMATISDPGYWLVASDGGVFSFGDAKFHGSLGGTTLNKPIVGVAATPDGGGYWLVASDGGVFAFGDAKFHGSLGATKLNKPIVGIASTADGRGYWLVASDGGVFAFGDAKFLGSFGNIQLNKPIVGIAATPTGAGYWLLASDGGVFTFGDATFFGSLPSKHIIQTATSIVPTGDGGGYWIIGANGSVYTFGDATFIGAATGTPGIIAGA